MKSVCTESVWLHHPAPSLHTHPSALTSVWHEESGRGAEVFPASALCFAVRSTPWWRTRTTGWESWCWSRRNASSTTASPVQLISCQWESETASLSLCNSWTLVFAPSSCRCHRGGVAGLQGQGEKPARGPDAGDGPDERGLPAACERCF